MLFLLERIKGVMKCLLRRFAVITVHHVRVRGSRLSSVTMRPANIITSSARDIGAVTQYISTLLKFWI